MLICSSCGHRLELEPGFQRKKIQCPLCGVMIPVPESALVPATDQPAPKKKPAPSPVPEDEPSFDWSPDPEPSSAKKSEPAPAPKSAPAPVQAPRKKKAETVPTCRHCGKFVRLRSRHESSTLCTSCGKPWDGPEASTLNNTLPRMELDDDDSEEQDDDSNPYEIEGGSDIQFCPSCRKELSRKDILCVNCGFDLQKRKKHRKTYQEMHCHWVNGLSWKTRFSIFLGVEGFVIIMNIVGAYLSGAPAGMLGFFVLFTFMLSFWLGTFDEIEIDRDRRGRVQVTKIWNAFFFRLMPQRNWVQGYSSVTSGQWNDAGFYEWFILMTLVPFGLIPGVIWWYLCINADTFHVSLSKDHGYPALGIYRGMSQSVMTDIAETLSSLSGLRYERA